MREEAAAEDGKRVGERKPELCLLGSVCSWVERERERDRGEIKREEG
jgi:hypothetical protein